MKIGIDISQTAYAGTGVARFTEGLTRSILKFENKHKWVFFFSSLRKNIDVNLKNSILGKGFKLFLFKMPPSFLAFTWNDVHLLRIERLTGKFDWFITSDWTEPPSKFKKATIIHDLAYLKFPETVHEQIRRTQKKRLRWVSKESKIIFSDSYSTKNDVVDLLKIDGQRVNVIYPGVEVEKPGSKTVEKTLLKFQIKKPFILTVGKIEPRKNLERLIEAFDKLQNDNIELLIIGPKGWGKIEKKSKNVRFLGFISDSELSSLYSSCLFFIYPSLWEGFGYPIVEAMRFGKAVATSNTSSLKEIAQNAGLLFDPHNVNDIKLAIQMLISDERLREDLARKGLKKSQEFSWENYYKNFIKILENN